jgi:hypothetical protein
MAREKAELGILISLDEPTKPMKEEAGAAGSYEHPLMGRSYPRIQIITIRDIIELGKRLDLPLNIEVLKSATPVQDDPQLDLGI